MHDQAKEYLSEQTLTTKTIVISYFYTWQNKDWDKMSELLSKDFAADGGQLQFQNREHFIEFCKNGPSWKNVELIDSLFLENRAALLYQGITPASEKIRVAEFLQLCDQKIVFSKIAISLG